MCTSQISNKTGLWFTKRSFPPIQHPPKIRNSYSDCKSSHLPFDFSDFEINYPDYRQIPQTDPRYSTYKLSFRSRGLKSAQLVQLPGRVLKCIHPKTNDPSDTSNKNIHSPGRTSKSKFMLHTLRNTNHLAVRRNRKTHWLPTNGGERGTTNHMPPMRYWGQTRLSDR